MFNFSSSLPLYIGSACMLVFGLIIVLARNPINQKKVNIDYVNKMKKPEETVEDYLERVRSTFRSIGKRLVISSVIMLCIGLFLDFYKS
ncbi:hypothetical protein C8Z91_01205 [Paenibacillus elgii]|uniref:Uncharacterized protein n=1 Tax=Paenibacillus elgii TaxID=189691 RepID=A0A2T6GA55_9BACL|nr:hypothetical protein C8Z91_01205 [Paenibacillus elgii]